MLTPGICKSYRDGVAGHGENPAIELLARVDGAAENAGGAAVFETTGAGFLGDGAMQDEVFGPATLIVRNKGRDEMLEIANSLEGQLTATIHGTEEDLAEYADLVAVLERKAGRLLFNGFPTGVEVCPSIVHGGPYPATGDGRSTSVGTGAIFRFARPVCYQSWPDAVLPEELQEANPLGVSRIVDGTRA